MPAKSYGFEFDVGDQVKVNATGLVGTVSALHVNDQGGLLYFVRSRETNGSERNAWLQIADIAEWVETPSTVVTSLQYFNLFSPDERIAIITSELPQVRVAVAMAQAAGTLDLADPVVLDGLDQLEALGLISAESKARIKANEPPVVPEAPPAPADPTT